MCTWWRHQMETFSALLAICAGNSPVPGEFPAQKPATRSFDVFFGLCLNKRLSKQSWGWWFVTLSHPLWRLYDDRFPHQLLHLHIMWSHFLVRECEWMGPMNPLICIFVSLIMRVFARTRIEHNLWMESSLYTKAHIRVACEYRSWCVCVFFLCCIPSSCVHSRRTLTLYYLRRI